MKFGYAVTELEVQREQAALATATRNSDLKAAVDVAESDGASEEARAGSKDSNS